MFDKNARVKQYVVNVLMGGETDKIRPFTAFGQSIFPIYYKTLGTRISLFDSVKVIKSDQNDARYFPGNNKMYLGFEATTDQFLKSLLVHEATHAVSDMIRMPVNNDVGEVLAYVAQLQYYKATVGDIDVFVPGDESMNNILKLAGSIAWNILNGSTPTASDYNDLRTKIAAHPDYSEYAAYRADFEGLSA
jgi:hypothetical protein